MRLTLALIVHEWRLQWRSWRFRLLAAVYLLAVTAPAAVVYFTRDKTFEVCGGATYAASVLALQPALTVCLALVLAADAMAREVQEGSWPVLSLAPASNSGLLLRRWLAVSSVVAPLTALPLAAAAALAAAAGELPVGFGPFLWPWVLQVLPLALAATAFGLGAGTIGRSLVAAAAATAVLAGLADTLAGKLLAATSRALAGPADWLGVAPLRALWTDAYLALSWQIPWQRMLEAAPEAPYPVGAAVDQLLPRCVLFLGLAAAVLGCAVAFLRRSRRDLAPWAPRPNHPLQTFLRLANRWREEFSPDAGLARLDRLVIAAGLAALAAAGAYLAVRDGHYRALGAERYAVETVGGPPPTPREVVATRCRLLGELAAGGSVRLTVETTLRNRGAAAQAQLAFSLNPGLRVTELAADRGRATPSRRWDRLAVRLEPPLPAGAERHLRFALSGAPRTEELELPGAGSASFALRWGALRGARFAHDLTDLSRSWTRLAISPARVDLAAADLVPVPRYAAWTLSPPPAGPEAPGREVPPESFFPQTAVEIDLRVPAGLWLADACGDVAGSSPAAPRLLGSCRLPLGELGIYGGDLEGQQPLESQEPLRPQEQQPQPAPGATPGFSFAVLPNHRSRGRFHLPSLTGVARLAGRVWPGIEPLRGVAVLEWPRPFALTYPRRRLWWERWSRAEAAAGVAAHGQVLLLDEQLLAGRRRLPPELVAAATVPLRLQSRRVMAPADQFVIGKIIASLVLRRVGAQTGSEAAAAGGAGEGAGGVAPPSSSAVLGGQSDEPFCVAVVAAPARGNAAGWQRRFDALMSDLVQRVGLERTVDAVEELLGGRSAAPPAPPRAGAAGAAGAASAVGASHPPEQAGSLRELFGLLERRSGQPLGWLYDDFWAGEAVPELGLKEVAARPAGAGGRGWRVTGLLLNRGTGAIRCPVVVTTVGSPVETLARTASRGTGSFTVSTAFRPLAVALDPEQRCFRYQRMTRDLAQRVELHAP